MRYSVCDLIPQVITTDNIGQQRTSDGTANHVYCIITSVSLNEWATAGQLGFQPQKRITVFTGDYDDEPIVNLEGKRYAVYRTYERDDGYTELYLQRETGVS